MKRRVTLIVHPPGLPMKSIKKVYAGEYTTWVNPGDAIPLAKYNFYQENPKHKNWVITREIEEPME
jgi:hypothetical protein